MSEWHLYEDARVNAAPVRLVPVPSHPGLWRTTSGGYVAVTPVPVRTLEQPLLGLLSAGARRVRIAASPLRWCLGKPLVYLAAGPLPEPPFTAWAVDPDGSLWREGGEGGRPHAVEQGMHSDAIWTLTTDAVGRVALVPEEAATSSIPLVYYLEVLRCREGT